MSDEVPPLPNHSTPPKRFRVILGDNFHAHDDSHSDLRGTYTSYADAVQAAMRAVDKSLRWERAQSRDPHDPVELVDRYLDFGDTAVIRPDVNPPFSSLGYAEVAAARICREPPEQ
ncbi:MAG: hypothetical protein SFU53_15020 [Terrimicrobiaceae bacterium]|nr:hypothetical protein [Terrimicrobiaceae bacterium]